MILQSTTEITVRYGETDMMGIVHHSVYALYYEQARVDFISHFGTTYKQIEQDGLMLPLIQLHCRYKKAVYFGDTIVVKTSVEKISVAKIIFRYELYNQNNELVNIGYTEHGFVSSDSFKPVNAKKTFPEIYEKLCRGVAPAPL